MKLLHVIPSAYWLKLIGTFVIPWVCIVMFALLYYPSMQRSSSEDAAQRHIETLSQMLAFAVGAGLSESNFDLVQTAFDWSKKDTNVTYLGIFDEKNKLIVEFNPLRRRIDSIAHTWSIGVTRETLGLMSVSPVLVKGEYFGMVVLAYSLNTVNQSIRHQQIVSVLVSTVVFAIGLWGTVLLAKQGSALQSAKVQAEKQAAQLAHQTQELIRTNENLEQSNRELHLTQDELQRAHDELEQRVEDRTARLAAANEEIGASLREKEVLLKEIHHRVKNNMQVISSLLNLQSSYVSNPQDLVLFRESQNRVKSMALIHEKLYRSESLARIDFGEYVRDLSGTIFRTYHPTGVVLDVDVKDMFFGVDTAIPCGLIVNELVSNSLKYGFPEGRKGRVFVKASCAQSGDVVLLAGDDGVGIPSEVDFRKSTTLGLQLVTMLVQQLGGTIELQREQGTGFRIVFPFTEQHAAGNHNLKPAST